MNQIFLISIIISITQACLKKQLTCKDLQDQISCESVSARMATCQWNQQTNQCKILNAICDFYDNEVECERQDGCGWTKQLGCKERMMKMQSINCEDFNSYSYCVGQKDNKFACTWEHNKCIPISKCNQINDFMQCRNSRLNDRCQLVINGQSSDMEKQYFYLGDLFDEYECRAQDCKYNIHSNCNNFVNGRRCFQYFGGCTQCSYFTSDKTCLETKQCTWDKNICRNIMCSDIQGSYTCEQKPFCKYNEANLKCETRTDHSLYCYAYDISSDPIKSTKNGDV